MTLADIMLPVTYEWGQAHALLFDAVFAQRIAEVQETHGDPDNLVQPVALADGRYRLQADILTWCVPPGPWAAGFAQLDPAKFDEIEVVPWAEAVLLPPAD